MKNVLLIASEAVPFIKTGGLADVAGSLPKYFDKTKFDVPFVCGAKDLGEALRRIAEGASMIRTKGEPGTGDIVQAVTHMRKMNSEIQKLTSMREDELFEAAKVLQVPYDLVLYVHNNGRLPVVNFAAGGVATPADAALMLALVSLSLAIRQSVPPQS